jgi:hypothetical protein
MTATTTTAAAPTYRNSNLKRLHRIISEDAPSNNKEDDHNNDTKSLSSSLSFHKSLLQPPLLLKNPTDAYNMVSWASQRLRHEHSGLADLYGVTLAHTPLPNISRVTHSQYTLGTMLGHGHFHAVFAAVQHQQDQQPNNSHHHHHHHHGHHLRLHRPEGGVVIKKLRPKLQLSASELSTGVADLVKEGLLLQALQPHPNILDIKGWSAWGLAGFATGRHDGFFLVLQELSTTLKDKMGPGGDWKEEDLFLQDRLGHDYAYGYYYHHHHPVAPVPQQQQDDDEAETPHKKKGGGGFFSRLFGSHTHGDDHGLAYRSPQAQKALVNKQHSFFLTRLQRCIEMADALSYMHDRRILHRDLKRK